MNPREQSHSVTMSRRDLLKMGAAAAALAACNRLPGAVTLTTNSSTAMAAATATYQPNALTPSSTAPASQQPPLKQPALAWLAANRLMFGPRTGDLEHIDQIGMDAFIEEQLASNTADGPTLATKLQPLTTLAMTPPDLAQLQKRNILLELQQASLLRAVYSQNQLYEVMVDFWTNHFNIYFDKNADHFLKSIDDRTVIRPNALGKFRDLLDASANSPAMLVYLDNITNRKGNPNENYARELMELHTIGVNGGYTQTDVKDVARAFTGWTIRGVMNNTSQAGQFTFNPNAHDDSTKTILGQAFAAGGGKQDGEKVLAMLARNPNCATFICTKLARRFIADQPPANSIKLGAAAFAKSDGDIKATLGAMLHSDEFKQSFGQKLKRPFELVVSALRAINADTDGGQQLQGLLTQMGQPLFLWPSPNGYPDANGAWTGAGTMLARWNFGLLIGANALKGTHVDVPALLAQHSADASDVLAQRLFGTRLPVDVQAALKPYMGDTPKLLALMIASPIFQTRG